MRIAYAVHGYGRGHAVRSLAVLSELAIRHDLLVLAGGDAAPLLAPFRPAPLPVFTFGYRGARLSAAATLRENAALLGALITRGEPVNRVGRLLSAFRPEVVVSDSEPFALRAAGQLGIPRVIFDHIGILGWCRPSAPLDDALRLGRDGLVYRLLMGRPERVVVSSFFGAPPRRPNVSLVPPVLRERVLRARPRDAGHLLVYFNQPQLLTARVLSAIAGAGVPALVYGSGRQGRDGAIEFRAIDDAAFVDDLASSSAVLSTAGHQLASEALYLGKPMLLCPEDCAEQRLNARELVRLCAGRLVRPGQLTTGLLREFLASASLRGAAVAWVHRDGNARAIEVLEDQITSLAAAPAAAAPRTPIGGFLARGVR